MSSCHHDAPSMANATHPPASRARLRPILARYQPRRRSNSPACLICRESWVYSLQRPVLDDTRAVVGAGSGLMVGARSSLGSRSTRRVLTWHSLPLPSIPVVLGQDRGDTELGKGASRRGRRVSHHQAPSIAPSRLPSLVNLGLLLGVALPRQSAARPAVGSRATRRPTPTQGCGASH